MANILACCALKYSGTRRVIFHAALAVAFVATVLGANPVHADPICLPHGALVSELSHKYDERSVETKIDGVRVFELLASVETWTILRVLPNGFACIVGVGEFEGIEI